MANPRAPRQGQRSGGTVITDVSQIPFRESRSAQDLNDYSAIATAVDSGQTVMAYPDGTIEVYGTGRTVDRVTGTYSLPQVTEQFFAGSGPLGVRDVFNETVDPGFLGTTSVPDNVSDDALFAAMGVNPRGSERARQLARNVLREQFDMERELYYPLEDELLGTINNRAYALGQAQEAYQQAEKPFERYGDFTQRRMAGYGLTPTEGQTTQQARDLDIMKSKSRISAFNNTIRAAEDRENQLISGGGLAGVPDVPGATA